MNIISLAFILILLTGPAFALPASASLQATAVPIPGGKDGIGFDDLNYSASLHKLLVPAGHTGKLYFIDPSSFAITSIDGFSSLPEFKKGHEKGISSVDEGQGYLFVPDHGTHQLDAVDAKTGAVIATAPMAEDPDFVRFVEANHEIWVTEPDGKDRKLIEVFAFTAGNKPALAHEVDINVADGPESLTIDVNTHKLITQWPNGCEKAHGTALDGQGGFLFDACGDGKITVFDLNQNGKQAGTMATGPGVDLIDYNAGLSHLYVLSSKSETLSVLGVSSKGELSLLGVGPSAKRAHCVAGDDNNNIWVCDPSHGQLLRYKDSFPAVK
jgi:DNA-binding beta-propeller fold protein YncE